ncbi:MAG TPA: metallophosphoesterase [Roseiflexaceae bacterium]|nr:metallophosphoesterase [Roseiflexaceae bacterium]
MPITVVVPTKAALPSATQLPTATLLPTPPTPQPWRFVVLGDTRTEGLKPPDITYALVERARQAQPEVVLCVGDMINALDTQDEVREQWRFWREAVAPLGAEHVLVTPGNHDVQGNAWATDLLVAAFPELPTNGPPGFEQRAYAFDYQGVRFISLDSEQFANDNRLGEQQLHWLETQLRDNPNRYTIVFSHAPAFPVGPHVGSALDVYPQERDRLWQLLRDYKVTAYVAGHEHLYNHQEIDGVQQIIVGTSGSWPYGGFGGDFFHYAVAEVSPEALSFVVYDQEGQERDRVVLH